VYLVYRFTLVRKNYASKRAFKKLSSLGINSFVLDGDNLRSTINKDLGFSQEDRIENNRRTAHIAKILQQSGTVPIVATISPNEASRSFAKSLFEEEDFIQIYLDTPLEICIERDVKNLYNSKSKKVKNITGVHSNYDIPKDSDIKIDTSESDINNSISKILKFMGIK
jgi:adenylyl-sulfate kinase